VFSPNAAKFGPNRRPRKLQPGYFATFALQVFERSRKQVFVAGAPDRLAKYATS
jgi:hypothetical protein